MAGDLQGLLRLVHQVTGFLIRLSPDQLTGIADGRIPLAVGSTSLLTSPSPAASQGKTSAAPRPQADARRSSGGAAAAITTELCTETVATLRKQETTNDGYTYLAGVRVAGKALTVADLRVLAAELDIRELPSKLTKAKLTDLLVDRAIGAQKRHAGLKP